MDGVGRYFYLDKIFSLNVLNMRRSSPPYKKKPQVFWWAGMWVRGNRTKPQATAVSRTPKARTAPVAHIVC